MKTPSKIAFVASEREDAQSAYRRLTRQYGNVDAADAEVIVALGGDGFMLDTLRRYMTLLRRGLPVYGMNKGTIGFLMNNFDEANLASRIAEAQPARIKPLRMKAQARGGVFEAIAFNEISLLRQTRQAAHIKIEIDGAVRLDRLMADGIMVSTPAGSTAYNLSAHGPVIPLGSNVLALTPISAFRPRRWRGALLKDSASVTFSILDPIKRPVSAVADNKEFRDVSSVMIRQAADIEFILLFDPGHDLDEKILREQFAV